MCGEAWTLVGLKHSIGESVVFSQVEIRRHFRGGDVNKLWISGAKGPVFRTSRRSGIGSVHFPVVVVSYESRVRVVQIIRCRQRNRSQRNGLAMGIYSADCNVRIGQIVK